MNRVERLTTQSEVFDGVTLKEFCESCGESDCREFCSSEDENPQCDICPVQRAFDRLATYEDIGSPDEFAKFFKDKAERHRIYNSALSTFGIRHQTIKCIEELSELQKELCKQANGDGTKDKVIEEMADVEIMLEQMKIGLCIGACEIDEVKDQKLSRLSGNIMPSVEKILDNELKCRMCLYSFMSEQALAEMGSDPCETRNDCRNWKPKEEVK
ncbi:MAG TPA: hypothetical protein VFC84_02040 [Desulfosporosinus sp.]|nr:hypothetical protein [Desulfosporosinus sp.]